MKKKIILIEDDDLIGEMYQSELISAGFETDLFDTGAEGLKAILQNHYDLLLLDIMLPDTNGIEILKEIRKNPITQNLRVAIVTNLGQEAVMQKVLNLGVASILFKTSYNPDQLVDEVKKLIENN